MAASVSGSKVVTQDASPIYTAAVITALFAIAPENMTYREAKRLVYICELKQGGEQPAVVVGSLFT